MFYIGDKIDYIFGNKLKIKTKQNKVKCVNFIEYRPFHQHMKS